MKIVLCGSIQFYKEMIALKEELEAMSFEAVLPERMEYFDKAAKLEETKSARKKYYYIKLHCEKIRYADAILVVNVEKQGRANYIGGNTFLEMGAALAYDKLIFVYNDLPSDVGYTEELKGMLPHVLKGDIANIKNFIDE